MKAINDATDGTITFFKDDVNLKGKASEIDEALTGVTGYKGAIEFEDAHTLTQLEAINSATSGAITFFKDDVKLKGKAADIASVFGITGYKGDIEFEDGHDITQLMVINKPKVLSNSTIPLLLSMGLQLNTPN